MVPGNRSIYNRKGLVNGHRTRLRAEKPHGIDIITLITLGAILLLIVAIFTYVLFNGVSSPGTHQSQSPVKNSASASQGILASGAVDVHPVYATLDENIPFAIRFTFTGNASTTYRMGAWIYGGSTSVNYSQVWTNGNFSNTSAAWGWRNQSYYTYFVTNETGKFSHWLVMRSTGVAPLSTYDYVLRVRFYEWNGTNWNTLNTVEYKNSTGAFKLVNVTQPGSGNIETGGWIWGYVNSTTNVPLDNRVVVVKNSAGTVLGTTFTEINGVDEGYDAFGSGYYRVAVKEGSNYDVEVWYDMELRGSISGVSVTGTQGTHVDITADATFEGITALAIFAGLIPVVFYSTKRKTRKF
ncbi:MAG: hypothetical protein N3F63_00120 [Thermoplasmata archaeon]|nr:hypothetical protein [Thermoplasmata archaeon]